MKREYIDVVANRYNVAGVVYSGNKMRLFGWSRPVVIDLKGITIPDKIPLLVETSDETLSRIGTLSASTSCDSTSLYVDGDVVVDSTDAANAVDRMKHTEECQYTIGVEVGAAELILDGHNRTVNGIEHEGPFYHVSTSFLNEVCVSFGRDSEPCKLSIGQKPELVNLVERWTKAIKDEHEAGEKAKRAFEHRLECEAAIQAFADGREVK